MNSERIIRIMAGSFILLSLLLGAPLATSHEGRDGLPIWEPRLRRGKSSYSGLWFTAFVGLNL